jgi:hypothetical protein
MTVTNDYPSNNPNLRPQAGGAAPDVPGVFPGAPSARWIYDIDPTARISRATFKGVVVGGGGGGSIFTPTEPGLVPPPQSAPDNSYLQADGSWHQDVVRQPVESGLVFGNVSGSNQTMYPFTITGLTPFLLTFSPAGQGVVPASPASPASFGNFLRGDATWANTLGGPLNVQGDVNIGQPFDGSVANLIIGGTNPGRTGSITIRGGPITLTSATTGAVLFSAATTSGCVLRGATDASNAVGGNVGEYNEQTLTGTTTAGTFLNLGVFSLGAGDWNVDGYLSIVNAGGLTGFSVSYSNALTGNVLFHLLSAATFTGSIMHALAPRRLNTNSAGLVSVGITTYGVGTDVSVTMRARRMR